MRGCIGPMLCVWPWRLSSVVFTFFGLGLLWKYLVRKLVWLHSYYSYSLGYTFVTNRAWPPMQPDIAGPCRSWNRLFVGHWLSLAHKFAPPSAPCHQHHDGLMLMDYNKLTQLQCYIYNVTSLVHSCIVITVFLRLVSGLLSVHSGAF